MSHPSAPVQRMDDLPAVAPIEQLAEDYVARRASERVAHLRRIYVDAMASLENPALSLQRKYDCSRDALVALYSLDAYGAMPEGLSVQDGENLCKEYFAMLDLKSNFKSEL
jgi:hypothetical protein